MEISCSHSRVALDKPYWVAGKVGLRKLAKACCLECGHKGLFELSVYNSTHTENQDGILELDKEQ